MKKFYTTFCALLLFFTFTNSHAAYPEKNITMIVPFAAGGVTDIMARAFSVPLSKKLGVTVVIKNTTGGGGVIGAAELAKSKPDGYTIGFMPMGPIVLQEYQRKLPYSSESFDYVGQVTLFPSVLMSSKKTPWTDFASMVAQVKANPRKYMYGTSGVGAIPHIGSASIFKTMKLDVVHMPHTDSATVMASLAGGIVHFYTDAANILEQHDLLPLAVIAHERLKEYPHVPTVAEVGLDMPIFRVWQGVLTPKGLSKDHLAFLEEAVFAAVEDSGFQEASRKLQVPLKPMRSAEFEQFIRDDQDTLKIIMTDLGFTKK